MVPVKHCSTGMPEEKVPIQVNADDAYLLATPPRRIKRPLVSVTDEQRNRHGPLAVAKRSSQRETNLSAVNCFDVFHDG